MTEDMSRYRRLVGKLIYFTVTRRDIAFAVDMVSQFMHKSRECHLNAAMKILEYIKGSPGKGLLLKNNSHLRIEAYFDASYVDDKTDMKSTSSYCTYVGSNLVTWRMEKQEAECRFTIQYRSRIQSYSSSKLRDDVASIPSDKVRCSC